eukprot:6205819-Pleurochrysis_carterae.AAC.2
MRDALTNRLKSRGPETAVLRTVKGVVKNLAKQSATFIWQLGIDAVTLCGTPVWFACRRPLKARDSDECVHGLIQRHVEFVKIAEGHPQGYRESGMRAAYVRWDHVVERSR